MKLSQEEKELLNKKIKSFMKEFRIPESEEMSVSITFYGLFATGKEYAKNDIVKLIASE